MAEPLLEQTLAGNIDQPWLELEALAASGDSEGIEAYLGQLSGVDAMRALLNLPTEQQATILAALSPKAAAVVLDDIPHIHAADLVERLEPIDAAVILESMPVEEQADLIGDIRTKSADAILSEMEPTAAGGVRNLVQHDPDTAGGLMRAEVFSFPAVATVGDVLTELTKSRFRKSCGSGQSADEEHDGGGVEEGAGRGDGGLEVLCQSPVAVDPGEEALHDPAARLDGEADLIGAFAHDLDGDHGGRGDLLAGVAAVGKDLSR